MTKNFDQQKIIKNYLDGISARQMARDFGCSSTPIIRILKKNNIKLRINKREQYNPFSKICECGCGNIITPKYYHKLRGIPRFISGHNSKINNLNKGKIFSLEYRKKLSISHKGQIPSEFCRKRASEVNKGRIPIHIDKFLASAIKFKKGHIPIKKSKEALEKLSILMKEKRKNMIFPLKDTSIEVKLQNFLKELKIEFFTHQYIHIKHGYQCDIFIPSMNLVIECDGNYWHSYPTGKDIDHIRTSELISKGFKVLRLWEFEINEMTIKEFQERLNV